MPAWKAGRDKDRDIPGPLAEGDVRCDDLGWPGKRLDDRSGVQSDGL